MRSPCSEVKPERRMTVLAMASSNLTNRPTHPAVRPPFPNIFRFICGPCRDQRSDGYFHLDLVFDFGLAILPSSYKREE
jgi:hypothetical protein